MKRGFLGRNKALLVGETREIKELTSTEFNQRIQYHVKEQAKVVNRADTQRTQDKEQSPEEQPGGRD